MATNFYRGEFALKLGEHTIVLKPTFANLAALENTLNRSWLKYASELDAQRMDASFKISELAQAVYCLKTEPVDLDFNDVGELLVNAELDVLIQLATMFSNSVYNKDHPLFDTRAVVEHIEYDDDSKKKKKKRGTGTKGKRTRSNS